MVYNSQRGRGFNDIFGTLNRTFKPVIEGAADVGANLATGLVSDLLSGKTAKTSIKERGNQAKGLVAQRALQGLQGGSGTKRKRKKRKQTGGIYPPIHYPGGNYPGYDMVGRGIFQKMKREMEKDCKDWYQRQQKGGRVSLPTTVTRDYTQSYSDQDGFLRAHSTRRCNVVSVRGSHSVWGNHWLLV